MVERIYDALVYVGAVAALIATIAGLVGAIDLFRYPTGKQNNQLMIISPTKRKSKMISYFAGSFICGCTLIGYIMLLYGLLPPEQTTMMFRPLFVGLMFIFAALAVTNSS